MSQENFRSVLAACAVVGALAMCAFVEVKSRNDGAISKDTRRIANVLELGCRK